MTTNDIPPDVMFHSDVARGDYVAALKILGGYIDSPGRAPVKISDALDLYEQLRKRGMERESLIVAAFVIPTPPDVIRSYDESFGQIRSRR